MRGVSAASTSRREAFLAVLKVDDSPGESRLDYHPRGTGLRAS